MSQDSQIYVRFNGKLIVANAYTWNYSHFMISRARWGIEFINNQLKDSFFFIFKEESTIEKVRRYFDVNFDNKNICLSENIVETFLKDCPNENISRFIFNSYPCCNGKLLIDINSSNKTIKYALVYDAISYPVKSKSLKVLSGTRYMNLEEGKNWKNSSDDCSMHQKAIDDCIDNLKQLHRMATLMNKEEVLDYLNNTKYVALPNGKTALICKDGSYKTI